MMTIALEEAATSLAELAARVEGGETIVVTRNGRPVLDLVPHRRKGGLDLEAGQAFLRAHGITGPFPSIRDDFDAPLPEDFLIRPLQRQAFNPLPHPEVPKRSGGLEGALQPAARPMEPSFEARVAVTSGRGWGLDRPS